MANAIHKTRFLLFLINNLSRLTSLLLLLEQFIMQYLLIFKAIPSCSDSRLIIYRWALLLVKQEVVIFVISMVERFWWIRSKTMVFNCFLIFNNV